MGVREKLAESKARMAAKKQTTEPEKPIEAYVSESPPGANKPPEQLGKHPPPKTGGGAGWEDLVAACGHRVMLDLYPDHLDKHRETRRKKLVERDCPECRRIKQVAKEKADKAAKQERLKNNPPKELGYKKLSRLPDAAAFDVQYHADETLWKGRLLIPDPEEQGEFLRFYDEAPGVFKLLSKLDFKWRGWIREHQNQGETPVQKIPDVPLE